MATVTTTGSGNPNLYPGHTRFDRNPINGDLYAAVFNGSANVQVYRSQNAGGSWASMFTLVRANIQEFAIFASNIGMLHFAYRVNESSLDKICWSRVNTVTLVQSNEVVCASVANGGSGGSVYQGVDLAVVNSTATNKEWIAIAAGTTVGASHGVSLLGVYLSNATSGTGAEANAVFQGQRLHTVVGTGRITPSLDIEHGGDGKTSSTPHLWCTFGRTVLYVVKCSWTFGYWYPPSAGKSLVTSVPAQNSISSRFDGTRLIAAIPNPSDTDTCQLVERNKANTATTKRTTATHTTGVIRSCTVSYDPVTGDARIFAVGTSTAVLYWTGYDRSAGTWSAWAVAHATAIVGATPENYSVRRSSFPTSKFDLLTAHATPTPQTIVHTPQSLSYPPLQPTWVNTDSGSARDVAATLLLDWIFRDDDPGDTQKDYALRKQEGAGSFEYWRASDSTWQAAEVKNASGTTAVTLPTSWGVDADPNHSYWVKTWDQGDVASVYSAALIYTPSALVAPTITAPTAAQVLTGQTLTVTWTVAQQTAYRLRVFTGGVAVYDSGFVQSAVTSVLVPYNLIDNTAWQVQLNTKNNEGLASATVTRDFTTNFVEPAIPDMTMTPVPASGIITVVLNNPTPVGSEPAVLSQDLYRRDAHPPLNDNPYATTNTVGWAIEGTTATSITRSTVQKHEGPASFLITCNGTAGTAAALHDNLIPVEEGVLYKAGGWIFCPVLSANISVAMNFYDATPAITNQVTTGFAVAANRWTYVEVTGVPAATSVWGKPRMRIGGTPPNNFLAYFDEVRFEEYAPEGDLNLIRVGAGLLEDATVEDWRTASGQSYEYRVLVAGVNGTSFYGPWTV